METQSHPCLISSRKPCLSIGLLDLNMKMGTDEASESPPGVWWGNSQIFALVAWMGQALAQQSWQAMIGFRMGQKGIFPIESIGGCQPNPPFETGSRGRGSIHSWTTTSIPVSRRTRPTSASSIPKKTARNVLRAAKMPSQAGCLTGFHWPSGVQV